MSAGLQEQLAFHLTGRRMGHSLLPADGAQLRPGLMARFGDLTRLRYDFPLVLVDGRGDEDSVQSLSMLINGVLQDIAPRGIEGEATRQHVLRMEREIRALAANGTAGPLSALWDLAAERIGAAAGSLLAASLARARAALPADGEVADCTPGLPSQVVRYLWGALQRRRSEGLERELQRLRVKLAEILQAHFVQSPQGVGAARLKASVGTGMEDVFDFDALSATLQRVAGRIPLPESRRRRILETLAGLESHPLATADGTASEQAASCVFTNCRDALAAFRSRLPRIVSLVRSMAIAELEIDGRYDETTHDPFFAAFDENSLDAADLGSFPDYLVCIASGDLQSPENADLMEILASAMPIRIVVTVTDILGETALRAHLGPVAHAARLGRMALGMSNAFVLQAGASHLYRLRQRLHAGLVHPGPALFSIFTGPGAGDGGLPAYLQAAAAQDSRAFPAFTYDPEAGPDWNTRFSLEGNAQPESDWPTHDFMLEDAGLQRVTRRLAFTYVDFVACDPRHAGHFAVVPPAGWNGNMVPVADRLKDDRPAGAGTVPHIDLVNGEQLLVRALVDERLMLAARRCREMWRSLREMGTGAAREAQSVPAAQAATMPAAVAAQPDAAEATAEAEAERSSDEAYIETVRCTTCNECTNLNNRMFAYDANKQAYIADLAAGTYRQLVEAAEACQVSIIHPGKPRDPAEPGLAELLKRAEPFA
jgi:hypothetical protein